MEIVELSIQGFGRLKDYHVSFTSGLNILFGNNEQGKSTLMAFIRAMFFGFQGSSQAIQKNDRKRYTPWDGSPMGGTLVFTHAGKTYRLHRRFGSRKSADKIQLMLDTTGQVLALPVQEEPGSWLFRMNESEFVKTVFIRQLESRIDQDDAILAHLSNLAGTGDAGQSYHQVDDRLRKAQTQLQAERGTGGRINDLKREIAALEQQRINLIEEERVDQQRINTLAGYRADLTTWQEEMDVLTGELTEQDHLRLLDQWHIIDTRQKEWADIGRKLQDSQTRLTWESGILSTTDLAAVRQAWQRYQQRQQKAALLAQQQSELDQEQELLLTQLDTMIKQLPIERDACRAEQILLSQLIQKRQQQLIQFKQDLTESVKNRERERAGLLDRVGQAEQAAQEKLKQIEQDRLLLAADIQRLHDRLDELSRQKADEKQESESRLAQLELQVTSSRQDYAAKTDELRQARDHEAQAAAVLATVRQEQAAAGGYNRVMADRPENAKEPAADGSADHNPYPSIWLWIISALLIIAGAALGLMYNPWTWLVSGIGVIIAARLLFQKLTGDRSGRLTQQDKNLTDRVVQQARQAIIQQAGHDLEMARNQADTADRFARFALKNLDDLVMQTELVRKQNQALQDRLADSVCQLTAQLQQSQEQDRFLMNQVTICRDELAGAIAETTAVRARIQIERQQDDQSDRTTPTETSWLDLNQTIAIHEKNMSDNLEKTGLADWEQVWQQYNLLDNLKMQSEALANRRSLVQNQLKEQTDFLANDRILLFQLAGRFRPTSQIEEIPSLLDDLDNQLQQNQLLTERMSQQQALLEDLLGGKSIAGWQEMAAAACAMLAERPVEAVRLRDDQIADLVERKKTAIRQYQAIGLQIAALESSIRLNRKDSLTIADLDVIWREKNAWLEQAVQRYQQIDRTRKLLAEAFDELQASFSPLLNEKTAAIMRQLSDQKYQDLRVDSQFNIMIADPDDRAFHPWDYLSGGTIDQVYLSLRLAISDLITQDDTVAVLPLLLDDVFIQYDEPRLLAGMAYLHERCRNRPLQQVLYFSCQGRIRELAEQINAHIHLL